MTMFLGVMGALGIAGMVSAAILLRAGVIALLWAWFVSPALGVPEVGVAGAIGLVMLAHLFAGRSGSRSAAKKEWTRSLGETIGESLTRSTVVLVLGWVVHVTWGVS